MIPSDHPRYADPDYKNDHGQMGVPCEQREYDPYQDERYGRREESEDEE